MFLLGFMIKIKFEDFPTCDCIENTRVDAFNFRRISIFIAKSGDLIFPFFPFTVQKYKHHSRSIKKR